MTFINKLEHQGFAVVPRAMDQFMISELLEDVQALLRDSPAGIRDLAAKVPRIRSLALSAAIRALVEPVLGTRARLIRSILFNKNIETNWQVAWHQDITISVRERSDLEGFMSWSVKDGIPHVQPPVQVLENMLSVRLHLDNADESNGALWFSPGSHRLGRLPANEAMEVVKQLGECLCAVSAGDALLFRPLTLHASRKIVSNRPRRVIHLEFSNVSLPAPLMWAEAAA